MVLIALVRLAAGFAISVAVGFGLTKLLPRLQFQQIAYEDAPQTHQKKTGTPTMGGLAFLAALLPWWFVNSDPCVTALLFLIFACAAIGFLDDYLAIRRGKNLGLRGRTKFLATALVAITFLRFASCAPENVLFHAGSYQLIVPHWLWLVLGILAITGTIHAVNLTDGLDGLAAGSILPPLVLLWLLAISLPTMMAPNWPQLLPFAVGGILGFLVYNRHPARLFMGDTGSLALGALLSGVAILEGEMLLLIVIGGVFVAEALSVMLQVGYFKATHGKRIFRMSPLHHHFELGGWHETKITTRFIAASLILSMIAWVIVR